MIGTTITDVLNAVQFELARATAKFPPMRSAHEASAIIREEYEEFWEAVKEDDAPYTKFRELVQIAAMCVRAVRDIKPLSTIMHSQPCPFIEDAVDVLWCGARGHKLDGEYVCEAFLDARVRQDCCRVYFGEKAASA